MQIERLRELTYSFLPDVSSGALDFVAIEKGGSGRLFFRVQEKDSDRSWVAMSYTDDRSDNGRFGAITDFLLAHQVAVPAIVGRREEEGFLLVQDLGSVDLGNFTDTDWNSDQRSGYEKSLQTVFALHEISELSKPADLPQLEFSFDLDLYQWEQDYFFNQYVARFHSSDSVALRDAPIFLRLREWLCEFDRSLVHRDFQSTNVMFQDDCCYLIDYQGMRFGLPEYDVASMVYDPYVDLSDDQRQQLIEYYYSLKQKAGHEESFENFSYRFHACAAQRLMQALGAYGFLGEEKEKKAFLDYIKPAEERLKIVVDRVCPELGELSQVISQIL